MPDPIILSTWSFGKDANAAAWPALGAGGSALDAVEKGINLAEEDLSIDSVGAGVGERVIVVLEGRAAGEALGRKLSPVDAAIVGIVDQVECVE